MDEHAPAHHVFAPWANYLLPAAVIVLVGAALYIPFVLALAGSPQTTDVGYAPQQPVPFSHKLHVGQLGMDCRYCHSTVEQAGFAALPTTETCMTCHASVGLDNPDLALVRQSFETGEAIPWVKVHTLPDYAYFNHAAHVAQGVGCTTCHGPVHEMEVVRQHTALSMAWCLDCHREPERYLRPREAVTWLNWDALEYTGRSQQELGEELMQLYRIEPRHAMENCSKCHR